MGFSGVSLSLNDAHYRHTLETDDQAHTLHCREFALAVGTNEAAATGTTNRALACYLHDYQVLPMLESGTFTILAEQGYAIIRR